MLHLTLGVLTACTPSEPAGNDPATEPTDTGVTDTETDRFGKPQTDPAAPFAVLELFTSEG